MNTTATTSTDNTLTAWAAALTATGWTVHDKQPPAYLAGLKELTDPAGRVLARACAYPEGSRIEVTLLSTARTPSGGATWHVIAGWLPAPVVIAAARDADEAAIGTAAGDLLTAAGWRLQRYEASADLVEHDWESPDGSRTAHYETEAGCDGGWRLTRPGQAGRAEQISAAQNTPAALIAALALSA
jgi:hypothetical protein